MAAVTFPSFFFSFEGLAGSDPPEVQPVHRFRKSGFLCSLARPKAEVA